MQCTTRSHPAQALPHPAQALPHAALSYIQCSGLPMGLPLKPNFACDFRVYVLMRRSCAEDTTAVPITSHCRNVGELPFISMISEFKCAYARAFVMFVAHFSFTLTLTF